MNHIINSQARSQYARSSLQHVCDSPSQTSCSYLLRSPQNSIFQGGRLFILIRPTTNGSMVQTQFPTITILHWIHLLDSNLKCDLYKRQMRLFRSSLSLFMFGSMGKAKPKLKVSLKKPGKSKAQSIGHVAHLHQYARSQKNLSREVFLKCKDLYTSFIEQKPSFLDYQKVLRDPLYRDVDPQYVYCYSLLLEGFLNQHEQAAKYRHYFTIVKAAQFGYKYLSNPELDEAPPVEGELLSREQERHIVKTFHRLCRNVIGDQRLDTFELLCQIMRVTRLFEPELLDHINQIIIQSYKTIDRNTLLQFLSCLVRSGFSFFPEVVYYLRDQDTDYSQLGPKELLLYFDIFVRSRLLLLNEQIGKIVEELEGRFSEMKIQEKVVYIYQCSKFTLRSQEQLAPLLYSLISQANSLKVVTFKILVLALYNLDYRDPQFLRALQKQVNLEAKMKAVLEAGRYSERELQFIQQLASFV